MQWQQSCFAAAAVGWAFCHMGFLREYRPPEGDRAGEAKFYVSTPSNTTAANEAKREKSVTPQMPFALPVDRVQRESLVLKTPLQNEPMRSTPENSATLAPVSSEIPADDMTPPAFKLYQNAPNPFRAQTQQSATLIRFDWPGPHLGEVDLVIYDILGQPVRHLFRGAQAPGSHVVSWDGKNNDGELVLPGKYWYRVKTPSRMFSKMLNVVR